MLLFIEHRSWIKFRKQSELLT